MAASITKPTKHQVHGFVWIFRAKQYRAVANQLHDVWTIGYERRIWAKMYVIGIFHLIVAEHTWMKRPIRHECLFCHYKMNELNVQLFAHNYWSKPVAWPIVMKEENVHYWYFSFFGIVSLYSKFKLSNRPSMKRPICHDCSATIKWMNSIMYNFFLIAFGLVQTSG